MVFTVPEQLAPLAPATSVCFTTCCFAPLPRLTLTDAGTGVLQASEAADSNYNSGIKTATFNAGSGTPTIAFTVPTTPTVTLLSP